jgi:hypothetical protein
MDTILYAIPGRPAIPFSKISGRTGQSSAPVANHSLVAALLRHVAFPMVEAVTRSRFWTEYRRSICFERLTDSERSTRRDRRLSTLLAVAGSSALQRQRLTDAGLNGDSGDSPRQVLERLAPAGKDAYRRHFPDGVVTGASPEDWRYVATSGTLERMTVVTDFVKRDHLRSGELRLLYTALGRDVAVPAVEIPPNACNAVCGLTDTAPQSIRGYLWHVFRRRRLFNREAHSDLRGRFERRVVLPRTTLPPIEPAPGLQLAAVLDFLLAKITAAEPLLLRAYPIYLLWLADRLRQTGQRLPGLERVCPFGGMTSPRMIARLEKGFGVPFADLYGTSELGAVAASCGQAPGMHVFEDAFIVEVLRNGQPVAPGEAGRIVVTDLTNRAMPLIRYDVGDAGRLWPEACACGRRTARLEVLGRVPEVLDTARGPLTACEVADSFFSDNAVANFRLEESARGEFDATFVPVLDGGTPDFAAWKDRFAALHGNVRRLRTRQAAFIRPETSGKYRFVHPCPGGQPL